MPRSVGGTLGEAFDADLSEVRVHADGEADRLAHSMHASAFTHGQDIYFARGTYSPGTTGGQRLLAHELAHVVQSRTPVERSAAGLGLTIGHAAGIPQRRPQTRWRIE